MKYSVYNANGEFMFDCVTLEFAIEQAKAYGGFYKEIED